MIRETITFNFEDEAQRERFHHRLTSENFESATSNGSNTAKDVLTEREACATIAEAFGQVSAKMAGGIGGDAAACAFRIALAIRERNKP